MIAKYHRLPEWLRWILFIPLTVLLTAGVCESVAWIAGRHYFIIRQVVAVGSFVLFISLLAPRWPRGFAIGVLVARIVLVIGIILTGLAYGRPLVEAVWIDIGRDAMGWVAAILIYWTVFSTHLRSEQMKPNQSSHPTPAAGRG